MDPMERLRAARTLANAGDYEAALAHHLWFHEHALEENRAVYGVRLSFALDAWRALGERHPPARAALEQIREREAARLLQGDGDFGLFHDIVSIDSTLGQAARTATLVAVLLEAQPAQAAQYARLALPALFAAGQFTLAERLLPEPEARIRTESGQLLAALGYRRRRYLGARFIRTHIDLYVRAVRDMLTMLEGCGRNHEARRLRALAVDLIAPPSIRRTVQADLQPGATPSLERGLPPWIRKTLS